MNMMSGRRGQDLVTLILAFCLFISPWVIGFVADATPSWNAWVAAIVLGAFAVMTLSAFAEWEEWVNMAIGLWLMFTRVTLGAAGDQANADHLIGALSLTVISLAAAEVARPLRYLLIPLGLALAGTSLAYAAGTAQLAAGLLCGLGLVLLSLRCGPIRGRYSNWQPIIR